MAAPGETPTERFREQLHAQIEQARREISRELTVIEALVRMGELDGAIHALDDQRLVLRAERAALERAIAGAVGPHAGDARPRVRVRSAVAAIGRSGQPRAAVVLAGALMAIGFAVSNMQHIPDQQTSAAGPSGIAEDHVTFSTVHAARERLATLQPSEDDALHVATEARALHDQILALPDGTLADERVRGEIQQLLVKQSDALLQLQGIPEVDSLLIEVRALSATLGLLPDTTPIPLQKPHDH